MTVAENILIQLGGGRFRAMTGAKNFIADGDALNFRLPANFAKDGINFVRVELTVMDLYTVTFSKLRKLTLKTVSSVENVYADNLQAVFTEATGLDTRMR